MAAEVLMNYGSDSIINGGQRKCVYELCSNCIKRQEIWLVYGFKYAYAKSIKVQRGFKTPEQDEDEGYISSIADDIHIVSGVRICGMGSICNY